MPIDGLELWWAVIAGSAVLLILGVGMVASMIVGQRKFLAAKRRRLKEQRLAESKYSDLFQNLPDIVFVHSLDGTVLEVNNSVLHHLGYKTDEIVGRKLQEFFPAGSQRRMTSYLEEIGRKRRMRGLAVMCDSMGGRHVFEFWNSAIEIEGKIAGVQGIARNITEQRATSKTLRRAEKRFRALVDASLVPIVVEGRDGILYANRASSDLLGTESVDALIGLSLLSFLRGDFLSSQGSRLMSVIEDRISVSSMELVTVHTGGEHRSVKISANPVVFGGENAAQFILVDLTERKKAEEALAGEKERLSVTLRSIGDGVVACDTEGIINLMSRAAETLTGWSYTEAVGKRIEDILQIALEPNGAVLRNVVETIVGGKTLLSKTGQGFLVSRNGSTRIISGSGAPITDGKGETIGAVVALSDITDKKRMEGELLKAEKMETVGLLAGGIAHDFNNILAAVIGNLSLARPFVDDGSDLDDLLSEVRVAAMRAKELTLQLQTFSTGGTLIKKSGNVADVVKEIAGFTLRGSNVKCVFRLAEDLWPVEADLSQMSQVFNNLIINADHAMPRGGTIEIVGENLLVDGCSSLPLQYGRYVVISIIDTGVGIQKDHLGRVFEPFFTTKQKGSGIGLASVYSVVKNHGGHVAVESEPGEGTVFHVYIPASSSPVAETLVAESEILCGTGRILVMDDEAPIRRLMGRLLETTGYEVETAKEGREAIRLFERSMKESRKFDIVILDLTIPGGLGGLETMTELLSIDPNVRGIIASGHFNERIFPINSRDAFRAILPKPFSAEELGEALQKAMADDTE